MAAIRRREVLLGAAGVGAALAAGCGGASGQAGAGASPDDMTIGAANAPASLIEYASVTCPHCREFYETVWADLKRNYIDTGKLRYTFREYPTPPAAVAVAGFQLARCGGALPEQYITRVGVLFDQQSAIFASGSMEGIRQKFVEIGGSAGLTENQVMTCINDPAGPERINRIVQGAETQFHVDRTPTLVLNGTKLDDPSALTYAGLSRMIDAAIAAHH